MTAKVVYLTAKVWRQGGQIRQGYPGLTGKQHDRCHAGEGEIRRFEPFACQKRAAVAKVPGNGVEGTRDRYLGFCCGLRRNLKVPNENLFCQREGKSKQDPLIPRCTRIGVAQEQRCVRKESEVGNPPRFHPQLLAEGTFHAERLFTSLGIVRTQLALRWGLLVCPGNDLSRVRE